MQIKDLKELDQLMRLCRKRGIETFKFDNIEFHIDLSTSEKANSKPRSQQALQSTPESTIFDPGIIETPNIQTPDELTEEQLLYYSSDPSVQQDVADQV